MRVFVTGATGFVGSAIVQELINNGHKVIGLARSEKAAKSLIEVGAEVHKGDLEDLESLRRGAALADAVIHTGFNHDFSKFKENCEKDKNAIEALSSVLAGSDRQLIITSAIGILPIGQIVTEETLPISGPNANPRVASEEAAASAIARGAKVSIVRLPPSVHGEGDHGFVSNLIGIARAKGIAAFVDEGNNTWPAVHRLDAAHLFRLVLERGVSGVYHAVAEEGVPFREIANVIGRRLNMPVVSKTLEEANNYFTWFTHFAMMDIRSSSDITRKQLGWHPTQPGLMEDLNSSCYFEM
ncbi:MULTISPECIES: SDR family oxidoreductase [Clostridium]|uniref:3-beta hydroxysteroid dehydrogenase n=1 Tax=Clostridium beijerinckii TaxID=1520 RepID=A0A1S9N2R5_CLOBE|nr:MULTISPECIES: SDR family oxidoreductase [Clostridium]MBN7573335.1 SDR family oxidoreductase [Clostridium beijerinckii]MBN7578674.1 SDR family oxidoreductase [Clostridium beijerinckii]MBN7583108.1 SDR family oxidoreductase [Clostridium beijerinckii]MBO0519264.1 SDR family oxidoreductase [Clostridium beijerinckii]MZK49210.1 NAD-dependent epimerase/dehydratase family protein [Clostridium beijerinckii]